MKSFVWLVFMLSSLSLYGQFDCNHIKLLGIYDNNKFSSQLSLLITNTSLVNDGNGNVYTVIRLENEAGDTIANSAAIFRLPNSVEDSIIYKIPIHEDYDNINDLPNYYSGLLMTNYPDCEIAYHLDTIPEINLPQTTNLDCNDFKVLGIYETANGGNHNYSFILTNTNGDSLRTWGTGYTQFQFVDENDEPVSSASSPSYFIPRQIGETIIVELEFVEGFTDIKPLFLKMKNPDCLIEYHSESTVNSYEVEKEHFKIYPNPTRDKIEVATKRPLKEMEIRDLNGRILKSTNFKQLDLAELNAGIYLMVLKFEETTVVQKIVKL